MTPLDVTSPPTVGETVWLYRADASDLWDRRPWRVVRVGPQYPHGLALELHAGPQHPHAVGHSEFVTYWRHDLDDLDLCIVRERDLPGAQLSLLERP